MRRSVLATSLLVLALAAFAALPAAAEHKAASAAEAARVDDAVTTHSLKLSDRGQTRDLAYTARAGFLALANDKDERTAEVFFVAYTANDAAAAARPLTFVFNGGPGAGSAYLNLGALGPRVLDFGGGRGADFADAKLIDNPDTWLDLTDLVFIDPVGTGYSRALVGEDDAKKQFYGVHPDLQALGQIVRLMLAKLDRFGSPIYLVGESYGGFRAARLPLHLASDQGIAVRGAVLVSPVLEFSLMSGDPLNPLPWALRLPSYAAVALEMQGKLAPPALKDAEEFALGEYLSALAAPPADAKAADALYAKIAGFTGLPQPVVARWQGRVPLGVFVKETRHDNEEIVSRYDGSVASMDPYPAAAFPQSGDPILQGLKAPLTSSYVSYVRDELQFKIDRQYELLNAELGRRWDWSERRGDYGGISAGASDDLREGLALDPRLKVIVAHGMTDLQTPYFASRYVIDHLPSALTHDRVSLRLYPGGHMMYLRQASRAALHQDARALYRSGE